MLVMTNRTRKLTMVLLIVGILAFVGLDLTYVLFSRGAKTLFGYDYGFFYYAFAVVAHHHPVSDLYNIQMERSWMSSLHYPYFSHNQYVYPPQFAVLLAGFAWLPFHASTIVWALLSIVGYISSVYMTMRAIFEKLTWYRVLVVLFLVTGCTSFLYDVLVSNCNWLIFFLLSLTFYLLIRSKFPALAGIPLGIAVLFKVIPGAVVLYLLLRRKWSVVLTALVSGVVVTVITVCVTGIQPVLYYVEHVVQFGHTSMKNGPAPYNNSIQGVMMLLQAHGVFSHWSSFPQTVFDASIVLWLGAIGLFVWKRNGSKYHDAALSTFSVLLLSPLVEPEYLMLLLWPVCVLLQRETVNGDTHRRWASYLTGVSLLIFIFSTSPLLTGIQIWMVHYHIYFWGLWVLPCLGTVLLFVTCWLQCWLEAEPRQRSFHVKHSESQDWVTG